MDMYWSQYSATEIESMYGVETEEDKMMAEICFYDEEELELEDEETEEVDEILSAKYNDDHCGDHCSMCAGYGCNYCYMISY